MNNELSLRRSICIEGHLNCAKEFQQPFRGQGLTSSIERIPNFVAGLMDSPEKHLRLSAPKVASQFFKLGVESLPNEVWNLGDLHFESGLYSLRAVLYGRGIDPFVSHFPPFVLSKPSDLRCDGILRIHSMPDPREHYLARLSLEFGKIREHIEILSRRGGHGDL